MSAIVCGKRSIFEELTATSPSSSSSAAKRLRCSFSPPRSFLPPPSSSPSLIDKLIALFPDMDKQIIEKALEGCGDDLDCAIRSLNELRLGSFAASADNNNNNNNNNTNFDLVSDVNQPQGVAISNAEAPAADDPAPATPLPVDGTEWVELFVSEMMSASNMDDARARASRALEVLERSIYARAGAEAAKSFQQENMMLKDQVQTLIQENAILKRAVSVQHERQKENEDRSQELQHLKQLVSQYQDQLRALEVNNYALTMHLKQAQQSSSIPGRFHPDIF